MKEIRNRIYLGLAGIMLFLFVFGAASFAQSTGFTYQGSLNDNNQPANGNYDFEFKLFDASTGGTQQGTSRQVLNVPVTNGIFTVVIDAGSGVFPGADRFMEIGVRPAGGAGFTTLTPRRQFTRTPYAIKSNSADQADSAVNANNAQNAVNSTQLGGVLATQFVQTTDSRLTDARNPLPNSTNYIQNGNTPQATSNFNISGNGTVGGTLTSNSVTVTNGFKFDGLTFLRRDNVGNLFLGLGVGNLVGGPFNTLVGNHAGESNRGDRNTFFGWYAGYHNTTGSSNTMIGSIATVGANNLTNASAIGAQAFVETSNSLVLGGVNGKNGGTDTNVGIGTTSPDTPLDIESQLGGSANIRVTNYSGKAVISGRRAGGTRSAPTTTQLNNILFELQADGYHGSAFTALGRAKIQMRATENWTDSANGAAIEFFTTLDGTTAQISRMIIGDNGSVGIGTTTPVQKLDVSGNVRIGTGTTGCVEDRDGTVIAGACSSDLRFKKNITPFGNILNNFSKLRPVNYYWRADEFADQHFGTKQSYGLIAQEVEELFPELVTTDEQGYKAVNYSKLPLYTIQAVIDLNAENEALKRQVEQQQKQLQQQQNLIEGLRKLVCQNDPQAEVCK